MLQKPEISSGLNGLLARMQTLPLFIHFSEFLPFKEFLVYPEAGFKKKPDYIEKISSPPDWGIIFDPPPPSSDQPVPSPASDLSPPEDESSTYSLLTEFERIKCSNVGKKLDDTQLEAVELAFENKLTLIQVCTYTVLGIFVLHCRTCVL